MRQHQSQGLVPTSQHPQQHLEVVAAEDDGTDFELKSSSEHFYLATGAVAPSASSSSTTLPHARYVQAPPPPSSNSVLQYLATGIPPNQISTSLPGLLGNITKCIVNNNIKQINQFPHLQE